MTTKTPCVLALGMFDGMHLGHQLVIRQTVEIARREGLRSVVYTFANHPREIFSTGESLLMSLEERCDRMRALGIQQVDAVPFDRTLADYTPQAFVALLMERYAIRFVVAGQDYTFGIRGSGTMADMRAFGEQFGFSVVEVPLLMMDDVQLKDHEKVSSTRIRRALREGDRDLADKLLARHVEGLRQGMST